MSSSTISGPYPAKFPQRMLLVISGYGPEIVDDDISYSTIIFSNVDWDGYEGIKGNIRKLPKWVNPKDRDFHLKSNSPCINSGTISLPAIRFGIPMWGNEDIRRAMANVRRFTR